MIIKFTLEFYIFAGICCALFLIALYDLSSAIRNSGFDIPYSYVIHIAAALGKYLDKKNKD